MPVVTQIGEPFETFGHWWLQAAPTQVIAGVFKSRGGHLELQLFGHFDSIDINERGKLVDVIHGAADAKAFTLWNCYQETPGFKFPGTAEQNFRASRVIIGGLLPEEKTAKFCAIAFDAPQVGPWIADEPVQQSFQMGESEHGFSLELKSGRIRVFGPTAAGHTFRFGTDVHTRKEAFRTYGIDVTPTVHIDFSEALSTSECIMEARKCAALLTLLVGEDIQPISIRLHSEPKQSGFEFLYPRRPLEAQSLIEPREVLAPMPEIEVLAVMDRWGDQYAAMSDPVNLLSDVLSRDPPATQIKLLLLAQSLEAFHRNVDGGEYLPGIEYDLVRRQLENAIPASLSSAHRASLKSRIRYGNELSLRTRLKKLLDGLTEDSLRRLEIDRVAFVSDVVDARNDFTHWVQTREKVRPHGAHLANLVSSLQAVTQLIFLRHLGVQEGAVVTRMLQSPWRYLQRYRPLSKS